ncbi:MAG: RNA polymerase sigma factor [Chloroflexi bacterium]|nr:RNA polymerase sigma factor [Chloroflexota bacterium]
MNKEGQDALFAELFSSYRQPIYHYLYRLLGSFEAAEDILQDVFVRAYRALPGLAPDANHRAWLYRIATNAARDHFRRQKLRQWLPLRDEEDGAHEKMADEGYAGESAGPSLELSLDVQHALEKLPLHYRETLLLYSVQEMTTAEIAGVLGIGQSAVKMRLLRARELFRQVYDEA